jgi:glycosyltransferase involved in cell wall biosynthesis
VARVAVVTSSPPLVEGGHLVIARSLACALRESGHQAGLILTPQNRFGRQASAYVATWLTDVGVSHDGEPIDQIVSLRFPSYAVRHRVHVCWLNHTMREYYDLWDRFRVTLSRRGRLKEGIRRWLIHRADHYLLTRNVSQLFAQSQTIQARLRQVGIESEVLYPPAPQRPYRCDGYGDYVLAVSRLAPLKRIDLLLDALARSEAAGVRCVIVGEGELDAQLRSRAAAAGLGERVTFAGRLGDEALVDHLARCRAVVFAPYAEDYGFVTGEAFRSAKAVITCRDSGGPAELVRDGVNGLVCDPSPPALAAALGRLAADAELARNLGEAARATDPLPSWREAVARLVVV